jgi:nucleoside-diphosphate-sugar epimerase
MRIGVTGGSGLIGRAVVDLARAQGHAVVRIDTNPPAEQTSEVPFINVDVTRYADLEAALRGCDALVHLAAIRSPVGRPDYEVHNTNVVASYNALSAAAHLDIQRVCQASSINATGAAFSRWPRYDYFPLDEQHPTYNEDPYSLSKWICEQQADSFARRYESMAIASLRFHMVVADRAAAVSRKSDTNPVLALLAKHLWGYTTVEASARACLLALTSEFQGHQAFYIVSPQTMMDTPSLELRNRYYPEVPVRGALDETTSFYDCSRAERLLRWHHEAEAVAGRTA